MASDMSVELLTPSTSTLPARRLPIGVGLALGAFASLAMWTIISFGLRALFA
jgi:hypothetical protein